MVEVVAFTEPGFLGLLADQNRSALLVARNQRAAFLARYLTAIGAKTLVVEKDYIDRNYLEDFAAYYVRCHAGYGRKCRRIHAFSANVTHEQIRKAALSLTPELREDLARRYLGYIVVKPLPQAFIGSTCLALYDKKKPGGLRHYRATAPFSSHLLGMKLSVESMPFQEQDAVVAACATTSVWSALQVLGPVYGRYTPTPAEITSQAAGHPLQTNRDFPSHGLNLYQIIQAIRRNGFEAEARVLDAKENPYMAKHGLDASTYLSELVVAYAEAGLPTILAHKLECANCTWNGLHAATISGFSTRDGATVTSTRVDEFYGHDDQAGPFARFRRVTGKSHLVSEYPHDHPGLTAQPVAAVIACYPKVRITYEEARNESVHVDAFFAGLNVGLPSETTLQKATGLQRRLALSQHLPEKARLSFAEDSPPRFLWSTMWYDNGAPLLEALFDATDVSQAFFCYRLIVHEPKLAAWLNANLAALSTTIPWFKSPYGTRWVDELKRAAQDWT